MSPPSQPERDRLLVSEIHDEARLHASRRELNADEHAAAVAALRELATRAGRQFITASRQAGTQIRPEPGQHSQGLDIGGMLKQAVHHGLRGDHVSFGENR